jgi:hypothetical protein
MYKPFAQCSLSDLAHEISLYAGTASFCALNAAAAALLLPCLRNAELTESVLSRHALVRGSGGLQCSAAAQSKHAWCSMLRDLCDTAGVAVSDAARLRIYVVCKECAERGRVRLCEDTPPPLSSPTASSTPDDTCAPPSRLASSAAPIPPAGAPPVVAQSQPPTRLLAAAASSSLAQPVQQTVPPPASPPVDARSYQQYKHALFQNIGVLPSVINLGKYNTCDGMVVDGFSEMSEAEHMLLASRLKAEPCRVTSLNLSANCTCQPVQLQMADATESMTALQSLDLSCNAACFVMTFLGVF